MGWLTSCHLTLLASYITWKPDRRVERLAVRLARPWLRRESGDGLPMIQNAALAFPAQVGALSAPIGGGKFLMAEDAAEGAGENSGF